MVVMGYLMAADCAVINQFGQLVHKYTDRCNHRRCIKSAALAFFPLVRCVIGKNSSICNSQPIWLND